MNILIVEGDDLARARRVAAFAGAGHCAHGVASPDDALRRLRRGDYHLVILDPFAEQEPNLAMLALCAISAPECHVILVTRTALFAEGELFGMMPRSVGILHGCLSDRDLVILCEEEMSRLCGFDLANIPSYRSFARRADGAMR